MSARIDGNRRVQTYEPETSPSETRKPQAPLTSGGSVGAGSADLVLRYRVGAARDAISVIASQLPGHGVDIDKLAQQVAASKRGGQSKAQVAAAARFAFVRAALSQNPALADRAIGIRTRGLPETDRKTVETAVKSSGASGLRKHAEAERVIRELRSFSAEERKDILGLMRAGASFDSAVAEEKKTLGTISREGRAQGAQKPASLEAQRDAAVKRAQTEAARWLKVNHHMSTAIRSVPRIARAAEVAVGAGAGASTVGAVGWNAIKSIANADASHLARAVKEADKAGAYMAGELGDKCRQGDRLFVQFAQQYVEYGEQSARFQRAVKSGDYDAINASAARMKTLSEDMTKTVRAFDAVAKKLGQMNAEFDAAAAHAAVHLALSAAGSGLPTAHPMRTIGDALEHGVKHSVKEAAVVEIFSELSH